MFVHMIVEPLVGFAKCFMFTCIGFATIKIANAIEDGPKPQTFTPPPSQTYGPATKVQMEARVPIP